MKAIELSNKQKEALKEIWFIYGNNGSKSTLANHLLIQAYYEHGEDALSTFVKNRDDQMPKKFILAKECEDVVRSIREGSDKAIDSALKIAKGEYVGEEVCVDCRSVNITDCSCTCTYTKKYQTELLYFDPRDLDYPLEIWINWYKMSNLEKKQKE